MKLKYELIDANNINLATSIQHTIFPDECAYVHYKYSIDTNYKRNMYYIIRWNEIPVGIIGLYTNEEIDEESIWLGWFGILPELRSRGFGRQSILDIIEKAKTFNKKYFRLYTDDDGDSAARPLYRSVMQICEQYKNVNDYNYEGNCYIYSYSLCSEKVKPWNDKFINLKEDIEEEQIGNNEWKDKYKILILSNPNDEEFIENLHIATSFREDGHLVEISCKDYDEKLEKKFDVIIKRNENEKKEEKLPYAEYKKKIYQYIEWRKK